MSTETSRLLDNVDEALKSVVRNLANARLEKEGTREEAIHVGEARRKLQVAVSIIDAMPLYNPD